MLTTERVFQTMPVYICIESGMAQPRLPYFDYLLAELAGENVSIEKAFGRHVHWGYWTDPQKSSGTDEDYAEAAENLTLQLCALANITDGLKVLDAGCGFGGTIATLNEGWQDIEMTGVNIDARQIERAREKVLPIGRNTIEFTQGDACKLPFPAAVFDRVFAVECIFHFPSRTTFLEEAYRVLKPGGVLAISDFVPSRMFLPAGWLMNSAWFERRNIYGRFAMNCTIAKYQHLANETGFVLETARDITGHTTPTYRYLRRVVTAGSSDRVAIWISGFWMRFQHFLAASGLLRYNLIAFKKV